MKKHYSLFLSCLLFGLSIPFLAKAQDQPKPFKVAFNSSGSVSTGNVNRLLIDNRLTMSYTDSKWIDVGLSPYYRYGEIDSLLLENELGADLAFSTPANSRVYALGFGSAETSNLRKIDYRVLGGLGAGWRIIRNDVASVSITNAFIYEETNFYELADIYTFRNSTRLKGKYNIIKDKIIFSHLFFYQPSIQDNNNYRWEISAGLEIFITKRISLLLQYRDTYESIVAEGTKNRDVAFTYGLSIANF
ncbi:MAG: DUF481 domain-containing protein [Cytophagales bacterium]|nr:MAG: DUF481 domain-containing protein [Cytophagales bacterium]